MFFTYMSSQRNPLDPSLERFLSQVARRGSWIGGGSVAALGVAASAALLEKLTLDPGQANRLRTIRRRCTRLVEQDAVVFSKVIAAMRSDRPAQFRQALRHAIDVPCRVMEQAYAVQRFGRRARRAIRPQFQSDVRCALAFAAAAAAAAHGFIQINLAWLGDPSYRQQIHRRLAMAAQRHER